jgi:hypothetical protein
MTLILLQGDQVAGPFVVFSLPSRLDVHRAAFSVKFILLLSRWLNDPQFVGSFETEDHVYFLFRESAVEYINCGKVRPTPIR